MPAPRGDKWEQDMEARLARLEQRASRPFSNTGFTCPAPMVTAVDGEFQSESYAPGANGWHLAANGNAEFNDLTLRGGIIGNDALMNPVVPGALSDESTGFGITTSNAVKLSGTITVPSGVSSAAIFATSRVFALDKSTTSPTDYLYSHLTLGGVSAAEVPLAVSYNGGSGTSISPLSVVLTGLGSSIAYSVSAHAGFDSWGSDALNRANVSGLILWFR